MASRRLLLSMVLLCCSVACSRGAKIEWSAPMERWYPNEVAPRHDWPRRYWSHQREDLFLRQLGHAELVALVRIESHRITEQFAKPVGMELNLLLEQLFYSHTAQAPQDGELLSIKIEPDSPSFRALKTRPDRVFGDRYLLLLRRKPPQAPRSRLALSGWRASLWLPPPPPRPQLRWTLLRADDDLLGLVRALCATLDQRS